MLSSTFNVVGSRRDKRSIVAVTRVALFFVHDARACCKALLTTFRPEPFSYTYPTTGPLSFLLFKAASIFAFCSAAERPALNSLLPFSLPLLRIRAT